jgi:hypothetical protein
MGARFVAVTGVSGDGRGGRACTGFTSKCVGPRRQRAFLAQPFHLPATPRALRLPSNLHHRDFLVGPGMAEPRRSTPQRRNACRANGNPVAVPHVVDGRLEAAALLPSSRSCIADGGVVIRRRPLD